MAQKPNSRGRRSHNAWGVIVVGIWASGGASVFPQRTVKELLSAQTQLNPIQATAELCGDPICVEGWRTDLGSFTRFDSEGAAE